MLRWMKECVVVGDGEAVMWILQTTERTDIKVDQIILFLVSLPLQLLHCPSISRTAEKRMVVWYDPIS